MTGLHSMPDCRGGNYGKCSAAGYSRQPEAVGREFLLNHAPYTVSGVVKDVSTLANTAYAAVWVPYILYRGNRK